MQMDELTQQNAALVEEATASSQAMADQARELNEMMSRYRTSGDVGLSSRSSSHAAADAAPTVSATADGATAADRRSKSRPWAKRTAAAGLAAAAAAPAPAPAPAPRKQAAAAGAGSDSDWQEF
jgi:hypothetical protein